MNRTLVIAIGILIAFCAGIYFWTEWQKQEFDASLPKPPAPEPETLDGVYVDVHPLDPEPVEPLSDDERAQLHAGLPPSAVPENIPERYRLPEEWKNLYGRSEDGQLNEDIPLAEIQAFFHELYVYVVENHNPKRPIAEAWPAFMEADIIYNTLAEQELGFFPRNHGGSNFGWVYEQVWAFPEFFELYLENVKRGDTTNTQKYWVYEVEMGGDSPNWNSFTLPDGRGFRIRRNTIYEFRYNGGGFTLDMFPDSISKRIVVENPHELSDEELARIGGWDYNINPYTGKPITVYRPFRGPQPGGEMKVSAETIPRKTKD